jgi:hypothetical protein
MPFSFGRRRGNHNRANHIRRRRREGHVLSLLLSSKDDLLGALADRFGQKLLEKIKTAVTKEPAGNWNGKLETCAAACVAGYLDSIQLHDILFYGSRPA